MDFPIDNEPLVLADGTEIDPSSGSVIKKHKSSMIVVPTPSEAQRIVARTRRTVAELPLPPRQLSGVALVAFYTLFGLPDNDISIALEGRLTVEQIKNIRDTDAYIEFMSTAKQNVVETQTEVVREIFEQHAKNAAHKIVELADSESDVLAFKASQDILDRAGHRPADIIEHRHKLEDALNIVYIQKKLDEDIPTVDVIDVVAEEITDA